MDTRLTLREFSLKVANKKGVQFDIMYGYDLSKSKSTPTYYVKASIDGKPASATKATLTAADRSLRQFCFSPLSPDAGIELLEFIVERKDQFNEPQYTFFKKIAFP